MPSFRQRLFGRFTGGARFGSGGHYSEFDNQHDSQPGRQTMAGKARVRKEIFITPTMFQSQDTDGFGNTFLIAGSFRLAPSGSIFTTQSSMLGIQALVAGAKVSASIYRAVAVIPVPIDADTSGSIIPFVDFTVNGVIDSGDDQTYAMYFAAQYVPAGLASCPVRTAACRNVAASYAGTASGEVMTAQLPAFPSFAATDKYLAIQVGWDAGASPGSTDATSSAAILGARIRYTVNKLGAVSTE